MIAEFYCFIIKNTYFCIEKKPNYRRANQRFPCKAKLWYNDLVLSVRD